MSNNNPTQLPAEVVQEVSKESEVLFEDVMDSETITPIFQKLTAYATKLHQLETHNGLLKTEIRHLNTVIEKLQQENDRLTVELQTAIDAYEVHKNAVVHYKNTKQILQQENEKMKEQATGWRPLLEKVLVMNEMWGDLPGEYINEVKKFLYGE